MGIVWQSDACIFLFLWHQHPRLPSLVTEQDVCESCSACFLWHSHLLLLLAGMRVFPTPSQPLVVTPGMSSSHSRGCVVTPRVVSICASLLANRPKPLLLGPFSTCLPLQRSVSVTSAVFPIGFLGISLGTRLSMASVSSVTRVYVPMNCLFPTGSIWHNIRFPLIWEGLCLCLVSPWSWFLAPCTQPSVLVTGCGCQ